MVSCLIAVVASEDQRWWVLVDEAIPPKATQSAALGASKRVSVAEEVFLELFLFWTT